MSSRKGAFSDDDLDDIDDLLPSTTPVVSAPEKVVTAPRSVSPVVKPARKPVSSKSAGANEAAPKRPRQTTRARAGQSVAEAHVATIVAEALRQKTHSEKQQRGRGRSYGEVVLDAIEQFEAQLRDHFSREINAKPKGRLFQRVDHSRPRRRRHTEPPVKIPLAGIIASDLESLDTLADEWHAGSRSALVDQALKFYLAEEIAALAGDPDDVDEPDDISASV